MQKNSRLRIFVVGRPRGDKSPRAPDGSPTTPNCARGPPTPQSRMGIHGATNCYVAGGLGGGRGVGALLASRTAPCVAIVRCLTTEGTFASLALVSSRVRWAALGSVRVVEVGNGPAAAAVTRQLQGLQTPLHIERLTIRPDLSLDVGGRYRALIAAAAPHLQQLEYAYAPGRPSGLSSSPSDLSSSPQGNRETLGQQPEQPVDWGPFGALRALRVQGVSTLVGARLPPQLREFAGDREGCCRLVRLALPDSLRALEGAWCCAARMPKLPAGLEELCVTMRQCSCSVLAPAKVPALARLARLRLLSCDWAFAGDVLKAAAAAGNGALRELTIHVAPHHASTLDANLPAIMASVRALLPPPSDAFRAARGLRSFAFGSGQVSGRPPGLASSSGHPARLDIAQLTGLARLDLQGWRVALPCREGLGVLALDDCRVSVRSAPAERKTGGVDALRLRHCVCESLDALAQLQALAATAVCLSVEGELELAYHPLGHPRICELRIPPSVRTLGLAVAADAGARALVAQLLRSPVDGLYDVVLHAAVDAAFLASVASTPCLYFLRLWLPSYPGELLPRLHPRSRLQFLPGRAPPAYPFA